MLGAAGAVASLGTVAGFFDFWWWPFEMLSPFRLQYALALFVLAGAFAFWRVWRTTVLFGLLALLNVGVVLSATVSDGSSPTLTGPSFRAALSNVRTENQEYDRVLSFLANCDPDLIVLEEVDSLWISRLAGLKRTYSHSIVEAREDNFGIALFSKLPIQHAEKLYLGDAEVPSISARINVNGRDLTVLATHPLPPGGPAYSRVRNSQLAAISTYVAEQHGPILLLGDLNATPWCHPFRKLMAATGLKRAAVGKGLHLSWPVEFLPLRIPIDHCLVSSELAIASQRVGPNVGSDHFPLVVDCGFVR